MLTAQQERCISRAIMQKFNFRALTPEEQRDLWQEIQRKLQQDQLESPTTIRDDMFRDLRRAVQISAALRFSHRCKAKSEIMKERQAAEASDVLLLPQLSQRLSVPPTSLLKVMMKPGDLPKQPVKIFRDLEGQSFSTTEELRKIFAKTSKAVNVWFLRELLWAFENDLEALQVASEVSSQAFEDAVFHFCGSAGVPMKREADLREDSQGVTPDVLFEAPVRFVTATEEMEFKWLECKNFHAGSESGIVLKGLQKQVKRYTTALGPGAVVFAGGASEKVRSALKRLGVAALDGSKLTTDGSKGAAPSFISGPRAEFWKLDLSKPRSRSPKSPKSPRPRNSRRRKAKRKKDGAQNEETHGNKKTAMSSHADS